jgi:CheY-like chemotaxis protein
MVEECISFYLQEKDLKIDITSTIDANAYILCDEDKITQVLRNLLSNAIKITPHGKITIEAKDNKGYIVFSVLDAGPGIGENKDIFNEDTSKKDIVGIGLVVSKAIIKAHGGKIWAENNPDQGANFSFTLPLPNIFAPSNKVVSNVARGDVTTQANIMAIDDEETCLLSLTMMLHKTNYILYKFSSPIKALECLYTTPVNIDIILLDMMMPELDGIEVLMKLKSHEKLKNIPVIMQSGIDDIEQINNALSMGVKDFIRKPYSREILITAIENFTKSPNKN